jgi:hypothetical protein
VQRGVLAQEIGLIASLLVRRVLKGAPSRDQFYSALADQVGDEVERKQLLAGSGASGHHPPAALPEKTP